MANRLRIIPLGGTGEIGKNMTLFEYGRNILIVDCGSMFPENDMWGIDLVIPDFSYLRDKFDQVRGLILTHGHEDHTGALPYLLRETSLTVYCTRLTRGLVEVKVDRAAIKDRATLQTIQAGERLRLGPFDVSCFSVNHSIPDGIGLAIRTPVGTVVHSGDFKLDLGAGLDSQLDLAGLAQLGGEGVSLLMADSTGAERPGFTPPERVVEDTFERIFAEAPGRVIVATFASLLSRVQQVIDVSVRHNRKVAVEGRSMVDNVTMAQEMGYLRIPPDTLIDIRRANQLPPSRVTIVATGSQGEPRAALARMAAGTSRQIEIRADDTIIVSAQTIPGNEETVNRIINQLIQRGANVIYGEMAQVHVSGHGSQEDQKLLIRLLRPRYFMPIHGEPRHQYQHARLARQMGISPERILIMRNGDVLELGEETAEKGESISQEEIFVDGAGVGDVGPAVLRDREILSRDGFVVAAVSLSPDGRAIDDVQIVSRGFVYLREAEDLLQRMRAEAMRVAEAGPLTDRSISERVQRGLESFLLQETGRRPMVIALVIA